MIFIDREYKCHVSNPNGIFREVKTDFFDGKCDAFIEGHMYIPSDESWTRSDGVVFRGKMVAPWKDYDELEAAQREYERQLIATYEQALRTVGVKV